MQSRTIPLLIFSIAIAPGESFSKFVGRRCPASALGEEAWDGAETADIREVIDAGDEEWDGWEVREVEIPCSGGEEEYGPGAYSFYFELGGRVAGSFCEKGTRLMFVSGARVR